MLKLAISYVKREKKNSYIIVGGIAITIIMIFSLIQIGNNLMNQYRDMMYSYSNYDMYIEGLKYDEMLEIHQNYESDYSVTQIAYFANNIDGYKINYLEGVDGDWLTTSMTDIIVGTGDIGLYEVVVEEGYAEQKNLSVGDNIDLVLSDEKGNEIKKTFKVCGIVDNVPSHGAADYIFVSMETALDIMYSSKLVINEDVFCEYILIDRNDYPEEELRDINSYLYEQFGLEIYKKNNYNETKWMIFDNNKSTFLGLRKACYLIVGFIAFVLVIFLYYMLNLDLEKKRKQYGTLRALGMTQGMMVRLMFCQLLLYGLIGSIIGMLGGYLLNRINSKTLIYYLIGEKVDVTSVNLNVICCVEMILLIVIVLVTFVFWHRIRKLLPVELIHNKNKLVLKKRREHKDVYLDLILNNRYRNKANSFALSITIFLSIIMVVISMNGMSSIKVDKEQSIYTMFGSEIAMLPNEERNYFTGEEIEAISEQSDKVYKQSYLFDTKVYVADNEIDGCNIVIFDEAIMDIVCDISGYPSETKSIVIGDNIQVSSPIRLEIMDNGVTKFSNIEIEEKSNDREKMLLGHRFFSEDIIILNEKYAKSLGIFNDQWLVIFTTEDLDTLFIQESLEYSEHFDLGTELDEGERQLKGMVYLALYLMTAIIMLSVFLIYSIIIQNFHQRKKEIGMLRAIGVHKRRMMYVLIVEVFIIAIPAIIMSFAVTVPISMYINIILYDEIGTKLVGFVLGLPLIIALMYIVAAISANNCLRTNMMEMLRGDE